MKKEISGYLRPDEHTCTNSIEEVLIDPISEFYYISLKNSNETLDFIQSLVYGIITGGGVNVDLSALANEPFIIQAKEVEVCEAHTNIMFTYDEEYNSIAQTIVRTSKTR